MTALVQKMKIKPGSTLRTQNAPSGFARELNAGPDIKISPTARNFQQVHWFVTTQAELKKELPKILPLITEDVVCWIYFPKGSSKVQTDLTRDKGWDSLLAGDRFQWLSLVSFNDTWSAFAIRLKTDSDKKRKEPKKENPGQDFIDTKLRTVRLPDDFEALLSLHPKEKDFFDLLSFTNKREYVEWIVSAKREETRATRLNESLERLKKKWKNPSNR